jgi:hypothetical protein
MNYLTLLLKLLPQKPNLKVKEKKDMLKIDKDSLKIFLTPKEVSEMLKKLLEWLKNHGDKLLMK